MKLHWSFALETIQRSQKPSVAEIEKKLANSVCTEMCQNIHKLCATFENIGKGT